MKNLFLFVNLLCCFTGLSAQGRQFFSPVAIGKTSADYDKSIGVYLPKTFDIYSLELAGLSAALAEAPWEFTPEAAQQRCVIQFPSLNGGSEPYSVWKIAMLEPELAAAFPEIQTYGGVSLRDKRQSVRFSITPRGLRAMVMRSDLTAMMIKPAKMTQGHYMIYNFTEAARPAEGGPILALDMGAAGWIADKEELFVPPAEDRDDEVQPVELKVYRYCVGAPGEFTQDHGGTKPMALAAVTEYTNLVSAVMERDIDTRVQLITGTQYTMFVDPATDPYNLGASVQAYAEQNTEVMAAYVNANSHDIAHVYVRYQGGAQGVGGIGVTCNAAKATGCSASTTNPATGDYYDRFLVIIGQEIGHQLSGGHTWNRCNGGGGRDEVTAFEPGSGSTIMSYGGGCGPDDYVDEADLYYHSGSVSELRYFVKFAGTCGTVLNPPNNHPEVTLNYPENFNIPISTPFELKGTATDPDGDPLLYSWDGAIYGPECPLGQPVGDAATFRSWPGVDVPTRTFPRLSTVLSNGFYVPEQLPTYTRNMKFRLIARDNKPGGGGSGWADVEFQAQASAGPFRVSSPNTSGAIWHVGELTPVIWDVANTNGALVNCQKVNIILSTDGGQTWPNILASNTENDGSQYVVVPNILSSQCRIRVEAADNIFFDLSNANFKIQNPAQPSLTVGLSADAAQVCLPGQVSFQINTASVLGYNTPVSLELVDTLPTGATGTFSATTLNPGESASFDIDLSSVPVQGTFNFTIRAISGVDTFLRPFTLSLQRNDFTGFILQSPADGSTNLALTQVLHWGKGLDADRYDVQFSDSPAFTNILASATAIANDSLKINFLLEKGKAYYWRVRPRNECGIHAWTEPFFFSTFAENCLSFEANDLPKNMTANGTPTIESKINVFQGGIISDIVLQELSGYHEYFKDLEAHLISPSGTDILLFKDRCSSYNGPFKFGLSDDAPTSFTCPPSTTGNFVKPSNPLQPFINQSSEGSWTLRLKDNQITGGGVLSTFKLQFCQSVTLQPPFIVNNVIMPLPTGTNKVITPDFLQADDPNNAHAQIVFTLVTVPKFGQLVNTNLGGELKPGDTFTQADLDAGVIRFYDYGTNAGPDGFRFVLSDGEGGFLGTPMFIAQPLVGSSEPLEEKPEFSLFPNPAGQQVWIAFDRILSSGARVSLLNMAGQTLRSETMAPGQTQMAFELNNVPTGVYMVMVRTTAGTAVRKLVIE